MPDPSDPETPSRGWRHDEAGLTRRQFLGGAVTLCCAAPLAALGGGCGAALVPGRVDGWEVPAGTTLAPRQFAALAALFDALVPGDPEHAGATEAHAAYYLDQLLGAFRTEPPRLFAGGPYSGRHGGVDGFSQFQPLTRVERLRWQTYLEGSQGIPEREWAGPVVGLGERYRAALDALDHAAAGGRFARLGRDERRALLMGFDEELVSLAYGHAVEGTYGDPVYGGNFEGRGWAAIGYEGDRQPVGYSAREMAHPEAG